MKAFAPGKLVLTGAYAVLHGAPAIVVATSRGAVADGSRSGAPSLEVRAALGDGPAPLVDASALFAEGDRKFGLGASSAILVASLAVRAAERGADLAGADVRADLFREARRAHAAAQGGGSGVDVAASVYGGAVHYVVGQTPTRVAIPSGLRVHVFACGVSARTSELRAEVDRLARTGPAAHRACLDDLAAVANDAARAVDVADAAAFVLALRRTARALARLGDAAGVGIVPAGFDALEALASREDASMSVSGAGGGDVAVYVGPTAPSPAFLERADALGLSSLDLSLDTKGVRIAPAAPAFAAASPSPS